MGFEQPRREPVANSEGPIPVMAQMPQGEAFALTKNILNNDARQIFEGLPLAVSPEALRKGVEHLNAMGKGMVDAENADLKEEKLEGNTRQIEATFNWPMGDVRMTRGHNGVPHFEVL